MLFNSYEFIFLFLPVVLAGYFFFGRRKESRWANAWLALASLFFYAYWDARYLPLLLGSILANYLVSGFLLGARATHRRGRQRFFFLLGLLMNLGLLCWYKYMDFFLGNVNLAFGIAFEPLDLILPLGISFFTITQVLYLLDCHEGVAKDHDFLHYVLFVSFFPHLLAGPILYHKPMMRQFSDAALCRVNWENMARGMCLFIIGLAKKVVIADSFISYVRLGFFHATELTMLQGWLTAICYMIQLYFDFSGYSDMAVGLARMMNIQIPVNFNSPFRASSLINFWQRWHISLTNAITACIYMPILRSFKETSFRHTAFAAFVSFFLVGVWHGAGWNYVVFALMHAVGIVVNHGWRHARLPMPQTLGRALTLLYVLVAMVFFRADSLGDAVGMLCGMMGCHGIGWPSSIVEWATRLWGLELPLQHILYAFPAKTFLLALLLLAFSPNSNALAKRMQPTVAWFLAVLALFAYAIFRLGGATDFLYFQF